MEPVLFYAIFEMLFYLKFEIMVSQIWANREYPLQGVRTDTPYDRAGG